MLAAYHGEHPEVLRHVFRAWQAEILVT